MTARKCLRCGQSAKFVDAIDTPFCCPCARHQETADPDLLPMRPIEDAATPTSKEPQR